MALSFLGRRRRWRVVAVVLVVLVAGAVAAFPWALGTPPARRWLLSRANHALAPGGLNFATIRFSWFGPTRITGLTLLDPQGEAVIDAPTARWDRNLWQILVEHPRMGTLVLERAGLDVEREQDGTVDLYEALRPILGPNPKLDLTVLVDRGHLRFRGANMPAPVIAEKADVRIWFAPAPNPLSWRLALANRQGEGTESLDITGAYDRWRVPPGSPAEISIAVRGNDWPLTFERAGLAATGRLHGAVDLRHVAGSWSAEGDATLREVVISGKRLRGDQLALNEVKAAWSVAESPGGLTVRKLAVTSPVGSIQSEGTIPPSADRPSRIEGTLDLAAIARQLPRALGLRKDLTLDSGSAVVRMDSRTAADRRNWDVEAKVTGLKAHDGQRELSFDEPATVRAAIEERGNLIDVRSLSVTTSFLNVTGQGDLDRGLALTGELDLAGLQRKLEGIIDFGALQLAGRGRFTGAYQRTENRFNSSLEATLTNLKVAGLRTEPFEREAVGLKLVAQGPASDSGLPNGWADIRGDLKSGRAQASVHATEQDDNVVVATAVDFPFTVGGREHQLNGRATVRSNAKAVSIEPSHLVLKANRNGRETDLVHLTLRGELDRAKGELRLTPLDDAGTRGAAAIAIVPEGIRVSGIGKGDALRFDGGLTGTNEALAALINASQPSIGGRWAAYASARSVDEGLQVAARVDVQDVSWLESRPGDESSAALSFRGVYQSDADRLEIAELAARSSLATVAASGEIAELSQRRLIDLKGRLTPDWDAINQTLAARVEPGARLQAQPRDLRLKGSLTRAMSEGWQTLDADLGFDRLMADVYGMKIGPAPLVVHVRDGAIRVEPIDTTINEGRLHLEPEIVADKGGALVLRLGEKTTIKGATINDEVSHRVLSFVAPVLESATRVHGRVSVALDRAELPLQSGASSLAKVDGTVQFEEVEFAPGPLVDDLFGLTGAERKPSLKLDEPVSLTIADRKVHQRGFAIPIGRATRIELSGSVDFDRNLALMASLPLTPRMVGNNPFLGDVVEGTRISVPIGGTLDKPRIDKDAMKVALRDLGSTLLERAAGRGAAELLFRLTRPRDPNAPPPPTPAERRARRQQQREERRMRREGVEPPPMPGK
jgi:translocation and assembly module TamB